MVADLRLGMKLGGAFGIVLVCVAIVGGTGWWASSIQAGQARLLYGDNQNQGYLSNIERAVWELRFGIANFPSADAAGRATILADHTA